MDVLGKIRALMERYGWSEYQLARRSGVPQSTLNSMFRKNNSPSLYNLDLICKAFGMTLSDFFAEGSAPESEIMAYWAELNPTQRQLLLDLLRQMK